MRKFFWAIVLNLGLFQVIAQISNILVAKIIPYSEIALNRPELLSDVELEQFITTLEKGMWFALGIGCIFVGAAMFFNKISWTRKDVKTFAIIILCAFTVNCLYTGLRSVTLLYDTPADIQEAVTNADTILKAVDDDAIDPIQQLFAEMVQSMEFTRQLNIELHIRRAFSDYIKCLLSLSMVVVTSIVYRRRSKTSEEDTNCYEQLFK